MVETGVSAIRLWRQAQVRGNGGVAFREAFLDLCFVFDRRHDDNVFTILPVCRRGDFVVVGQLQRIDYPQDLVEVATGAGRVGDGQAHLLVRIDHEQRTHRQGFAGIGVNQVVELGNLAIFVRQDREVHKGVLRGVDVADPLGVGFGRVHGQGNRLDVALVEFVLEFCGEAQLGGAYRGEVGRMREQYRPFTVQPFVKPDRSFAGVLFEVGCDVAEFEAHSVVLLGW